MIARSTCRGRFRGLTACAHGQQLRSDGGAGILLPTCTLARTAASACTMAHVGGNKPSTFKIVLLGEGAGPLRHESASYSVSAHAPSGGFLPSPPYPGCVGKTSLVLQYCQSQFVDKHIATLQASFLTKKLNVNGQRVDLAIWVRRPPMCRSLRYNGACLR